MIGGTSWASTQAYYRLINAQVNTTLEGLHSSKALLSSVDFAEIEECQIKKAWDKAGAFLTYAAARLEKVSADFIIVCTNIMQKVAPEICIRVQVPLIHIADTTGDILHIVDISKVGLLATKYTMQGGFYTDKLADAGIDVLISAPEDIKKSPIP